MAPILPDAWSLHFPELDDETQYVQGLANHFQQKQNSDDPHCDADQQESDTPEERKSCMMGKLHC